TIDVRLYTIAPKGHWYYVAHIPRCEVITLEQSRTAWDVFLKRGWAKDMQDQAKAVGGKLRGLSKPQFNFNVRFRPNDAEILDPMEPVGDDDALKRLRRYTLTLIQDDLKKIKAQWPDRRGRTELHGTGKQRRRAA